MNKLCSDIISIIKFVLKGPNSRSPAFTFGSKHEEKKDNKTPGNSISGHFRNKKKILIKNKLSFELIFDNLFSYFIFFIRIFDL